MTQRRALLGGHQGFGLVHHLLEELLHHVGQRLHLGVDVVGQGLHLSLEVVGHGLDLILDVGDEGPDLLLQLGGLRLNLVNQGQDLGSAVLHVGPVEGGGSRGLNSWRRFKTINILSNCPEWLLRKWSDS